MDNMKEKLKLTMDSITEKSDIVSAAKIRANETRTGSQKKITAVAAVLLATVVCGFTVVAAVSSGWLRTIFGDSAQSIEENIADYTPDMGDIQITSNNHNLPFDVSVGEVICDGGIMYFDIVLDFQAGALYEDTENLHITALMEVVNAGSINARAGEWYGMDGEYFFSDSNDPVTADDWKTIAENGGKIHTALRMFDGGNFKKGDSVNLRLSDFKTYKGDDCTDRVKYRSISDYSDYVMIRFNFVNDPVDMTRIFTPSEKINIMFATCTADISSVEISPLRFTIKGDVTSNVGLVHLETIESIYERDEPEEITLTFKNGDTIKQYGDYVHAERSGSNRTGAYFMGTTEIAGYFDTVIPIDEIVSIQIGDYIIPVE